MMNTVEPIAVVGLGFKFPGGAEDSESFWQMLIDKKCAASEYPSDRLNIDAYWHPDTKRKNIINSRDGHFIKGNIGSFDAGFFSIAPHEAIAMDPQQRLLLETTYHAIENAGLRMQDVAGRNVSVHVGTFTTDYSNIQFKDLDCIPKYNSLGTAGSMQANRISWFYDLRGESMYIDTACSSSLTSLALACQGLHTGQSEMAIVCGSNAILAPDFSVSLSNMSFLSPTGRCNSFDAKGDGYGRGEGFASVLLKPLSRAIADGNPIRALVRSVGTNQDGYTSSGITQPSKDMQLKLIQDTYRKAGLDMKYTRFFEAHGTGTAIGDPIEARAIGQAFFKHRSPEDPIYVGAVKSNLGHLEGTSGLAGVVKAILALERGIIPPNTNFEKLNPNIDADFFNLRFPATCIPWPGGNDARRASINSFGFGGSNAHAVLEATNSYLYDVGNRLPRCHSVFTKTTRLLNGVSHKTNGVGCNGHTDLKTHEASPPRLIILSAADEGGISRQAKALSTSLGVASLRGSGPIENALDDVVFTLNTHRTLLDWKSYAVLGSLSDFHGLEESLSKPTRVQRAAPSQLGLVLTGQGAQWARMGVDLISWPVFKTSLTKSQGILHDIGCKWNLLDELSAGDGNSRINSPEFSQTATTALQIALLDLLAWVGVQPSVVVGHSSGEIAAAYCAGHLCHESALRVSYFRGILSSRVALESKESYGMASIGLSTRRLLYELREFEKILESGGFCANSITISCMNSPNNTTISGSVRTLESLVTHLSQKGIFARKLKVDVGYHSPQMELVSEQYIDCLSHLRPGKATNTTMISSVEPGIATTEMVCCSHYWARNMVSPVQFNQAIEICCAKSSHDMTKVIDRSHLKYPVVHGWLEVGPHAALKGPLKEIFDACGRKELSYSSLLMRRRPAEHTFLEAIGQLFCHGFTVDLGQVALASTPESKRKKPQVVIDLPPYSFNHSTVYWAESARSKLIRHRVHANNPFIGVRVADWNSLDARWRCKISKDNLPWVSDHRLHGKIWYPAAGVIVMAVEALKQLEDSNSQHDIELGNVTFAAPIVVAEGPEGTDVEINLVPMSKAGRGEDVEYKFRVFVNKAAETWDEVCHGFIVLRQPRVTPLDINGQDEERNKQKQAEEDLNNSTLLCSSYIEASELYRKADEMAGLQYGPSFQGLTKIYYTENQAHATLLPIDNHVYPSHTEPTIHPGTLDSIFQLAIPILSNGFSETMSTLVPSHLTRLWISRKGAGCFETGPDIGGLAETVDMRAQHVGKRGAISSATVFSKPTMDIRVQFEGLEMTAVARDADVDDTEQDVAAMCHEMVWKADLALLDTKELLRFCSQFCAADTQGDEWFQDARLVILGSIKRAFDALRSSGKVVSPSKEKYKAWLQARLDHYQEMNTEDPQCLDFLPSGKNLNILIRKIESTGYKGEAIASVCRTLREILLGEIDPQQTLLADQQMLEKLYEVDTKGNVLDMLKAYLDLTVHKDPSLRFLQIGAKSEATTSTILDVITNVTQGPRCAEVMLTDSSFFSVEKAKEAFATFDRVQYRTLDIERNPVVQGFAAGGYDIIVAVNALHSTEDLSHSLSNIKKLLSSRGKLILLEATTPQDAEIGFILGSTPAWWHSKENFRQLSPLIDEARWDTVLKEAHFTGTDQVFRDCDSSLSHRWSIMVSSALVEGPNDSSHELAPTLFETPSIALVIHDESTKLQRQVADEFHRAMKCSSTPVSPEIVTLTQILTTDDLSTKHCILLADLGMAHLHEPDKDTFRSYQKILTNAKSVYWVQLRDICPDSPPYWSIVEGLVRVCRSENPSRRIITLTLESTNQPSVEVLVGKLAKVWNTVYGNLKEAHNQQVSETEELEYVEHSGYICIGRLRQAKYLDQHVFSRTHTMVCPRIFTSGPPITLDIRTPGLLDTLEWVNDPTASAELEEDQVEVQVRAIGVNFKDALTLLGRVNAPYLGSECAGYVTKVGRKVRRFKAGDRVAVGSLGTYKSSVRVPETHVVHIPDSISTEEAAGIITAFCTAYFSLSTVARLQKGESILIHAAAGGTGQAAVQIAKHIGAEVYATCSSAAKRKLLVEEYGVQEDHIFYSRNASFADGIKRMTNGRGVDVVLNSLSGKLLIASWEVIAEFGRFVEIGRKDIDTRGHLPMAPFIKNTSFTGVDLAALVKKSPQNILMAVFSLMAGGVLQPMAPFKYYPITQVDQALRMIVSGKSMGKIVLTIDDDVVVPVRQSDESPYQLSKDATYVIAGGLGGIGRQIAQWLVRRGAAHILLLSRSGAGDNPERLATISKLQAQGVNLRLEVCDICDEPALREALRAASETMPPIKGCIQASMDRPFATMTHQEWCEAVRPKVKGSWNLHSALPARMDFFVMLSSAVCIFGNPGQANYAAGNTFLDELARYRIALGEQAVAIDLGLVLGEGWVAKRKHIHDRVMQGGHSLPLSLRDVFALLDYYCHPENEIKSPEAGQIVTGIEVPALIRGKGVPIPDPFYRPLFSAMHQIVSLTDEQIALQSTVRSYAAIFREADTVAAAGEAIAKEIKTKLCKILGFREDDKSINDPLDSFGVDSLIALELRNWLAKEMKADLAVHEILGDHRLIDTGLMVANKSEYHQDHWET